MDNETTYKMNENQQDLVKRVVDYEANVNKAICEVKEKFDVDAYFNEEDYTLTFKNNKNAMKLIEAKNYVENTYGDDIFKVVYE